MRRLNKIDWELVLAVGTVILMAVLVVTVFIAGIAHAEGCLKIDVPPGAVISQYDGDTFRIFTFGPGAGVDIRVQDIDTPERTTHQEGWQHARDFTSAWLSAGPFTVETCGKRTFNRIVAVISRNGETLAEALREAGLEKK